MTNRRFFPTPLHLNIHIRQDVLDSLKTIEIQDNYCYEEEWVYGVSAGNDVEVKISSVNLNDTGSNVDNVVSSGQCVHNIYNF